MPEFYVGQTDYIDKLNGLATAAQVSGVGTAIATIDAKVAAAAASATTASQQATTATTQATSATTQASNAAGSASAAAASASTASTQASVATTQAGIATTQAGIATSQASLAGVNATNASNSAIAADSSASTASAQATIATTQANNAAVSFDAFDDRYLGNKTGNPPLDNDGNTLLVGALYWNTTVPEMRVWSGTAWLPVQTTTAAIDAAASALSASTSASTATTQAGIATTQANIAGDYTSTATTQAGIATTQATNAAASASTATTQAGIATTQAGIATTQADTATTQATAAAASATTATTQAGIATTQATNAAGSATTATTQAGIATTQATNSANSATTATTQAGIATTQAGIATTQATTAAVQAGIATTQAVAAAASFDAFDDRYLGNKTSNPSLDNDGNTLLVGALYWNTTVSEMRVWSGTVWLPVQTTQAAIDAAASAVSAGTSATTATTQAGIAAAEATTATTQAGIATTQATNAASSATTATTQAGIATTQATSATAEATTATTQAGIATTQATSAASSATTATTQAGIATTQAGIATTEATTATTQAGIATTQATNSASSATTATTQATNAASSATTATTQAGIATAQATTATTQATNAASSATTATTQAGIATTQATSATNSATTATTQAGIATTQADIATAEAATATTQAGIATTQATNSASLATLAQAWAVQLTTPVSGGEYSAKYWAQYAASTITGSLIYRGNWNANTGIYPSTPSTGDYWKVSVAGTVSSIDYSVNDSIIYNGSTWDKIDSTESVSSVAGKVGVVVLDKSDVGLANVDNTSDAGKPVSTATQTALDLKAPLNSPVLVTPNLGTPSAGIATNLTGLPLTTGVTGILGLANGGTGATTAQAAINTLAGSTTTAQYLRGNGTDVVMSGIQASDVPVLNQNTTGTAAGLSATLAVASGGTGATTAQAAINALAGSTTTAQYLRGNGTDIVMSGIQASDVPVLNQNTTGTAAGLSATLAVASGGTGLTTIAALSIPVANTVNTYTTVTPAAGQSIRINAVGNSWEAYTPNTGAVTSVTGVAPVVSSGGATPAISMSAASGGVDGYMTGAYATKLDNIATGATANTGTVTSVALSAPSLFTVTGSPLTTSGTLTLDYSGTALPVANGGTGLTTYTANGVLYASGAGTLASGSGLTFDGSNLGLGTAPGSAKFTIAGTAATTTQALLGSGSTTGAMYGRWSNTGSDLVWGTESSAGGTLLTGASAYAAVLYTNNAVPLQFGTGGTVKATLDASGNLGVGTTSIGGSGTDRQVTVAGTSSAQASFITNGAVTNSVGTNTTLGYIGTTTNHPFIFTTNNTERMRILPGGAVRIMGANTQNPWVSGNVLQATQIASPFSQMELGSCYSYDPAYGPGPYVTQENYATKYLQTSGNHQWYVSEFDYGDGQVVWGDAKMSLSSSGNLYVANLTASKPVFTDASKNLTSTGTVPVANGGTGLTSYTANAILYANSTSTLNASFGLRFDGKHLVHSNSSTYTWGSNWRTIQLPRGCSIASVDNASDMNITHAQGVYDSTNAKTWVTTHSGGSGIYVQEAGTHSWSTAPSGLFETSAAMVERVKIDNIGNLVLKTGSLQEVRTALPANDINLSTGNFFTKTISGATTLTVSNVPASGTAASFILDITNGGSAVITWWTGVKWAGGVPLTLTVTGRDVLGFFTHDGGTTWTGLILARDVR